jgi:hypothetical protein
MNARKLTLAVGLGAALLLPVTLQAQARDSVRLDELERRVEALTRELERSQLGAEVVGADTTALGFGPAASKVYRIRQGVSVGGYGEIVYNNVASELENGTASPGNDVIDALRGILYIGYKFNDKLLLNTEIEVEHVREIYLEFAYLDYRFSDAIGARAGLLLAPMGLVNELHEPPVFLGTARPLTETNIIPSTWRENGIGIFGGAGPFAYRAYVMSSFDGVRGGSSGAGGFGASGLRGGRQRGANALSNDFGVVGRLDFVGVPGLIAGASAFTGETAHNRKLTTGAEVGGRTVIWDLHADYKVAGLDLRALVAGATVDDVVALNSLQGLTGSGSIGEELGGWYVQGGYNVLRAAGTEHQLIPYVRYEQINTQKEVPTGFTANPATDQTLLTVGASWKPIPEAVLKADYNIAHNEAETGLSRLSVALGYLF